MDIEVNKILEIVEKSAFYKLPEDETIVYINLSRLENALESYKQAETEQLVKHDVMARYPSDKCDEACYYHCTKGGQHPPDCVTEDFEEQDWQ